MMDATATRCILCSIHVGEQIHDPDRGKQEEIDLADELLLLFGGPGYAADAAILDLDSLAEFFLVLDRHFLELVKESRILRDFAGIV